MQVVHQEVHLLVQYFIFQIASLIHCAAILNKRDRIVVCALVLLRELLETMHIPTSHSQQYHTAIPQDNAGDLVIKLIFGLALIPL